MDNFLYEHVCAGQSPNMHVSGGMAKSIQASNEITTTTTYVHIHMCGTDEWKMKNSSTYEMMEPLVHVWAACPCPLFSIRFEHVHSQCIHGETWLSEHTGGTSIDKTIRLLISFIYRGWVEGMPRQRSLRWMITKDDSIVLHITRHTAQVETYFLGQQIRFIPETFNKIITYYIHLYT